MDWSTIVEFFTKRGRPLSKEEITKLVEEDRRDREYELQKKRAEEEAEKRRNMRIMGELEEDVDFEAYEQRQKAEKTVMNAEAERRDGIHARTLGDEDDLERDGDDYDDEHDPLNAESPEIGNLSKTKLTDKDYIARAHSAKTRGKGKYGVTVPKPFGFDTRDARKSVTIRERKVEEMVNEKRMQEDMIIKH